MPLLLAPADTPPGLRDRLADLRRRWRRLVLLGGLFATAAVGLGVAVGVGLLDRAIHLPALIRAIALFSLVIGGGLFLIRTRRRLRSLGDDLALALQVEE